MSDKDFFKTLNSLMDESISEFENMRESDITVKRFVSVAEAREVKISYQSALRKIKQLVEAGKLKPDGKRFNPETHHWENVWVAVE